MMVVGVASCLWAAGPASAQSDEAEAASVERRMRLDYESYGLSLDPVDRSGRSTGTSPVYAFTRLEVEGGYDSNVRRTATGTTASAFAVTRPGVSVQWDGETHRSAVTGQAAIGRYGASSGDDYEDLELGLLSRIEVDDDVGLVLSGDVGRFHIDRGSDLDLGPTFGVQTYRTYSAGAELSSVMLPDTPMTGTLRSTWYRFDDVASVDRSALDRWIGVGSAKVGFARLGEVSFFVQPAVQRVDYVDNTAGNPDSTRLDLALGAFYAGGDVTQISGFVGASRRTFDQSGIDPELSALVGMDALWNATDLMTVTADLSLSNEDSELSAASSVTTTKLGLGVDYEVLDNLIFGTKVRWTSQRYQGSVADERLVETGVDVRYLLNEYAYLGAGLSWEDQASDDPNEEYRATVASLRFGLKLCCLIDHSMEGRDGRWLRKGVVGDVFR